MTPMIRVAILECDTPIESVRSQRGTYGDLFEGLLRAGSKQAGVKQDLVLSKWDVVTKQSYPDPKDVEAILLTGSSGPIHHPE